MLVRVSSKSRRKPSRAKTSPKSSPKRVADPNLRAVSDTLIDAMRFLADPAAVRDAYEAELTVSVAIGVVIQAGAGDDLIRPLRRVCDDLARGRLPHAYPALRTLAIVGPPEIRGHAAKAAERTAPAAERAGQHPHWAGDLGRVTSGSCVLYTDVYGDSRTLVCEFAYPGGARPHCVFAVIDASWHGAITKLVTTEDPAKTQRMLQKRMRREGGDLQEILATEAAAMLLAGIEAFLGHGPAPEMNIEDDDYGNLCASVSVVRHRVTVLAGPGMATQALGAVGTAALAGQWSPEARRRLVSEFLAAPHARDLDGPLARTMPFLIIATCVNQLGCDPLVTGPLLLGRMLLHAFPESLIGPDRFATEVPEVMRAWTHWVADRQELPDRQRRRLMLRLEFLLQQFQKAWASGPATPLRRYVQDLPDEVASDGQAMRDVVERRTFAIPPPGSRANGVAQAENGSSPRHADDLDAAIEKDRTMITLLDLSQRGLPQQRFAPYLTVTEQLWTGQPPEVWAAAQRMRETGLSRDAILDRLARATQ
jgi:hypothetical protein